MKKTIAIIIASLLIFWACGGGFPENYQSWYVPGYRTVNVNFGQPPNEAQVTFGALSKDIIVLSDIGSSVDYISQDGTTKWRRSFFETRIRALHHWDDSQVSIVLEDTVILLDIETGQTTGMINPINVSMGDFQRTDTGFITTTESKVYLLDNSYKITWTNPHPAKYPRSAIKISNMVVIADTFGHRVYGVDITTNEIIFEEDEYFPNMVVDAGERILVVGEHSNRVYLLDYRTGDREPIFYCDFNPFDYMYSTTERIKEIENDESRPLLLDPSFPEASKSICSKNLYSPNGAAIGSESYFIASTDDGTVLEVNGLGQIKAIVGGFNNPANVLEIRNQSPINQFILVRSMKLM